jgi:hypothetical protein
MMAYICAVLLFLLSILYVGSVGLTHVLPTLGGASLLIPGVWAGCLLSLRSRHYGWHLLCASTLLSGLVLFNHTGFLLYSGLLSFHSDKWTLVAFMVPFAMIEGSYGQLIEMALQKKSSRATENRVYLNLKTILVSCILMPLFLAIPILSTTHPIFKIPIVLLSALCVGKMVAIGFLTRMNSCEVECLLKPLLRKPGWGRGLRIIMIALSAAGLASLCFEHSRGLWLPQAYPDQ